MFFVFRPIDPGAHWHLHGHGREILHSDGDSDLSRGPVTDHVEVDGRIGHRYHLKISAACVDPIEAVQAPELVAREPSAHHLRPFLLGPSRVPRTPRSTHAPMALS